MGRLGRTLQGKHNSKCRRRNAAVAAERTHHTHLLAHRNNTILRVKIRIDDEQFVYEEEEEEDSYPGEDESGGNQQRQFRLLQMALVNEQKKTTTLKDLVRTAAQQKTYLETVIEQQAANIRRTEVLTGELAAGKLQAEDRLEEQTLRFAYAQTKKQAATETIRDRLG